MGATSRISRVLKVGLNVNVALFIAFVWITFELLALTHGWLNSFFWGFDSGTLGIDFWSVPRGFINLESGKSIYDTFRGNDFGGPSVTWYLSNPIFAVVIGPFFSFVSPAASYALWCLCTVTIQLVMGFLFASRATSENVRAACLLLSVIGFPGYAVLATGNPHAWMVLGLGLVLLSVFDLMNGRDHLHVRYLLMAGLLVSMLTKPLLICAVPMLLILADTRRTTLHTLAIYVAISLLALTVPALNPEGMGLKRNINLLLNPAYVHEHMNIYKNQFVLTSEMKDNSIHWFNLIAQSDFYWDHVQIFSLSAFTNNLLGLTLPSAIFKLPLWLAILSSCLVITQREHFARIEAALWSLVAISTAFFLSYNTVWEYQYSAIAPVSLLIVLLWQRGRIPSAIGISLLVCCLSIAGPSLYFALRNPAVDAHDFAIIRINRVVPVVLLFSIAFAMTWRKQSTVSVQSNTISTSSSTSQTKPPPMRWPKWPFIAGSALICLATFSLYRDEVMRFNPPTISAPTRGGQNAVELTQKLVQQGQYQQAADAGLKALQGDPQNAGLMNNTATALLLLNHSAAALELFKSALVKAPNTPLYENNLRWARAVQAENEQKAERQLKAIEQEKSFHQKAQLLSDLASTYIDIGRPSNDISMTFEKAILLDPNNDVSYNNYGVFLMSLHRSQEALAQFQRATAIKPGESLYRNNRDWAKSAQ